MRVELVYYVRLWYGCFFYGTMGHLNFFSRRWIMLATGGTVYLFTRDRRHDVPEARGIRRTRHRRHAASETLIENVVILDSRTW